MEPNTTEKISADCVRKPANASSSLILAIRNHDIDGSGSITARTGTPL